MNQNEISKITNFFNQKNQENSEYQSDRFKQKSLQQTKLQEKKQFYSLSKPKNAFEILQNDKAKQLKKSLNKFNPYAFSKLNDKQKRQTFLSIYEQLNLTKVKLQQQIQKGKQLKTKLHMIEHDYSNTKKFGELTMPQKIRMEKQKDQQYLQLKNQNRRLLQKLNSLQIPKRIVKKQHQPVVAKKVQKNIIPVNQNFLAELEIQKNNVKQLLQIISQLKKNKLSLEEQLKEKQRVNTNTSSVVMQKRKPPTNVDNSYNENMIQEMVLLKQKLTNLEYSYQKLSLSSSQKINELSEQLKDQKDKFIKKEREYTNRIKQIGQNSLEKRIQELELQNQKYQNQIRRMVSIPFYTNNKQTLDLETKIRDLEAKLKARENQLVMIKQSNTKYLTEIQFKKKEINSVKQENKNVKKQNLSLKEKQLSKGSNQLLVNNQDYYRKALNLTKWQGDDPIWRKYSTLSKPQIDLLNNNQLKKLVQKLWIEKLQLLAHLEKAQNRLKIENQEKNKRYKFLQNQKASAENKLEAALKKLDEYSAILSMKKGYTYQIYQQKGIKYDDTVSVFSADEQDIAELQTNQNYFDLYIGLMELKDDQINKKAKGTIRDIKNLISFLTIDFYNHDTEHTTFAEGLRFQFKNKISFKVQANEYFIHYLQRDSLKIQLWASEGSSAPLLASGTIFFKDFIIRSQDGVAPVIHSKCILYSNDNSVLGTVEYRIRMRLPISPFLKWIKQKKDVFIQQPNQFIDVTTKKKRLIITIQRGLNLSEDIQAFVYFEIQNQDFYTQPQKGPTPLWDYHKELQIMMTQEFEMELKKKYVQFTLFDDRKPMGDDIVGIAQANLTPLLTQNKLNLKLDVKNNKNQKIGILIIKISWV